jgi:hypothetical protein
MKITVVTNCTARKSVTAPGPLRARSLPKGTLKSLAKEWKRRLAAAEDLVPAADLYQGRAFKEATKAARLANTPLYIISGGLGLIKESDSVPAYSVTVTPNSPDAVPRRLEGGSGFRNEDWWQELSAVGIQAQTLARCIRTSPDHLFVLALSAGYLSLVAADLLSLPVPLRERVRIIGPRREIDIPAALRRFHMPYDDRLDGARSPIRGTESDFPQRATLHFVELALSSHTRSTPDAHRHLVKAALENWPRKKITARKRLSESALRRAIAGVLRECDDQWSRALRRLRDNRNIACEQKRFRRICTELIAARG